MLRQAIRLFVVMVIPFVLFTACGQAEPGNTDVTYSPPTAAATESAPDDAEGGASSEA